jgi:hypothetical protein
VIHPQDILVALKLVALNSSEKRHTYDSLGRELFMSTSQVFRSVKRAEEARLISEGALSHKSSDKSPWLRNWPGNRGNLKEFLIYGAKYVFPVERGGPTRGVPTADAAVPLSQYFPEDYPLPPVWPYEEGTSRGFAFAPLHESVPRAALRDPKLYELLALVDAIRGGRARERELAIRELSARIDPK